VISSDFSRIAHLPGSHADVDDLVLNDDEAAAFLAQETLVFEKLDGLNVMITSAGAGRLQALLKSDWRGVGGGRVETAIALAQRESSLARALPGASCLYGEWLWHTVSVPYTHLDDVFVAFSLRDHRGRLVSHDRMANQLEGSGVAVAQPLCRRRLRHPFSREPSGAAQPLHERYPRRCDPRRRRRRRTTPLRQNSAGRWVRT
jgi:hypothetical protein